MRESGPGSHHFHYLSARTRTRGMKRCGARWPIRTELRIRGPMGGRLWSMDFIYAGAHSSLISASILNNHNSKSKGHLYIRHNNRVIQENLDPSQTLNTGRLWRIYFYLPTLLFQLMQPRQYHIYFEMEII